MQHTHFPELNLVVMYKGKLSADRDLRSNLDQFIYLDGMESRSLLKKEYFTILAHGEMDRLAGLNIQASLGWIHNLCSFYGQGRKILVLACDTGVFLARDVAVMLRKQVIAPLGLATFDHATGNIIIVGDKRWNKSDPFGNLTQSKSNILTVSFLK